MRINIYELLGFLFYNKLSLKDLKSLKQTNFATLFTNINSNKEIPGIKELQKNFNDKDNFQSSISLLRQDYQSLFEGPGNLLAPPWESVYLSDEKLMFEEQTLQVRQWYQNDNLQISNYGKEPEDHMGLELQYMAFLAKKSLQLLEDKKLLELNSHIAKQKEFLLKHPLRWVDRFAEKVQLNATTSFYRGLGLFLPWYLEYDLDLISSLILTEQNKEVNL